MIKRMLYGSATKDDLKNRNSLDDDDEEESDVTSDDMESVLSVDRRQSRTLPRYFLKKTTSTGRINFKLRRNSVEDSSERDGSPSPPLDPKRISLDHQRHRTKTLPRRTKSSSNNSIVSPGNRKASYAFGSSTERFCTRQESEVRCSNDNLSGTQHFLSTQSLACNNTDVYIDLKNIFMVGF